MDQPRHHLLADFLRTRRARLSPADLGLPSFGRRRTPGLRREEVAQLAGVGVTWYTWLEQGRAIGVSDQVIASIARVLQLGPHETSYLFTLLHGQRPASRTDDEPLTPSLIALLAHQGLFPAFYLGYRWDILAWNKSATLLLGDLGALPLGERNHVWQMFMNPATRACLVDWEAHAQRMIAEYRLTYGQYLDSEPFTALVDRLRRHSPEFSAWWPRHDVVGRLNIRKEFEHPVAGRLVFDQTTMLVSETQGLKLVVKVPAAGTDTARKLQELSAAPAEACLVAPILA